MQNNSKLTCASQDRREKFKNLFGVRGCIPFTLETFGTSVM